MISKLGRYSIRFVSEFGELAGFSGRAAVSLPGQRHVFEKLTRALFEIGVRCVPITLIVGLFTGLVLGLQLYYVLTKFSSESLLGQAVALSIILEIGPVFTAIMIVGQAGSALSAEIGIQRNAEQIDALHTMQINPIGFLVSPRLWAAVIAFPILTTFFDLIGIYGGYLTGVQLLGVDPGAYWNRIYDAVSLQNIFNGLVKAFVFGIVTTLICSFQGYYTHIKADIPGARGVSQTTTRAVVYSSIAILVFDYLITSFQMGQ
ncbi:MlaE family ABC transporter permease [Pelagicoccus mobilis]|uniref:ABC transporter permease n=1 Tax=Pelagicoccus mobilis TaxID=415221 RepID=A0A934VR30_9BACT|nr:ABC transporter permease [Pelagicoccus mobilis]MBK1877114.1 ABC transporter permease [Pelagicoccus mobilis]